MSAHPNPAGELARINRNLASQLHRQNAGHLTGRNSDASADGIDYKLARGREIVTQLTAGNDHMSEEEFSQAFGTAVGRFWTLERRALGM